MTSKWKDPKVYKPTNGTMVLTKSMVDGIKYNHVAYYVSSTDEWYTNYDDLMYSEYIVGWMKIPE